MRIAETVTFGGSGLDRAAHLRGDAAAVEAMLRDPAARVLPIWRGKPLFAGDPRDLGWLAPGHAALSPADEAPVFLGLDGGPRFAVDISAWQPEEIPDTVGAFFDPSEQRHPLLPADHAFGELRANMTRLDARAAELVATAKAVLGWHETHGLLLPLRREKPDDRGRLAAPLPRLRRAAFPAHRPGRHHADPVGATTCSWAAPPAGPRGCIRSSRASSNPAKRSRPPSAARCARKRAWRCGRVDYLASQPWPFPASLMLGCRGEATTREIRVDPVELEDARWVSREEMLEIVAGRSDAMKPARKGAIARFLIEAWLADKLE